MEEINNDVSNAREKVVQARLRGFLAEGLLKYPAQQFRDISEILCVDADGIKRP
jgi:hypothetical protein